jgi:hypothetical protein
VVELVELVLAENKTVEVEERLALLQNELGMLGNSIFYLFLVVFDSMMKHC